MKDSNFEQDNSIKSHEEILELFDEIKIFEDSIVEFVIEETKRKVEEDLIEGESEIPKIVKPIPIKVKKDKTKHIVKPFYKTETPATFKIRFNDEGKLINLDFKKVNPSIESKPKKKFSIKNLKSSRSRKKEKSESKEGKLKGSFGKLSKLKKVIPSKGKKKEKTEPAETEE